MRIRATRSSAMAAVMLAVGAVTPTRADTAWFSVQGDLTAPGDQVDVLFTTTSAISTPTPFAFTTNAFHGGTNSAGETIAAGGIDSALNLFSGITSVAQNDDAVAGSNFDSNLTWSPTTPTNPTSVPLSSPFPAGSYRLNLSESGNNAIGAWAVEMKGPPNSLRLTGATPVASATIRSLKFGSDTSTAIFNQSAGTFTLQDAMVVGQNGSAALNVTGGTLTVGGIMTVNLGSTVTLTAGTLAANDDVNVVSGTITGSPGAFQLAAGKTLNVSSVGMVNFTSSYSLNGGRAINVAGGSTLQLSSNLNVGDTTNGTLTVSNSMFTCFGTSSWGKGGASASLDFNTNTVATAGGIRVAEGTVAGTSGQVQIRSGSQLTSLSSILVASDGAIGGSGTITITGAASRLIQTGSGITVGHAANGSGTINVENLGTFTTGTGQFDLKMTGTLNIASGGTVNANGDVVMSNSHLHQTGGTFNLASGKKLTARNNSVVNLLGTPNLQAGTTSVSSGSTLTTGGNLDLASTGNGSVTIDGAGSTLTTNTLNANDMSVGVGAFTGTLTFRNQAVGTINSAMLNLGRGSSGSTSGTLNLESGAQVTVNSLTLGSGAAGTGTIDLTGSNSILNQTAGSTLTMSAATGNSFGQITVRTGAVFNTGTGGITINRGSQFTVLGGTLNANADITVFSKLTRTSGTFNLLAGRNVNASTTNAFVSFNGSYAVGNGSTFSMASGADLTVTSNMDVGVASTGTVIMDGAGSVLTTNSLTANPIQIGSDGGIGIVTIRNSATATIGATSIAIADSPVAGTTGALNINTAGQLTALDIYVGTDSAGTGVINVTGASSKLTQTGASVLSVGGWAGGTGAVNIQSGGTFLTGTGLTTISANGAINNAGGTFAAAKVLNHGTITSSGTTSTGALTGTGSTNVTGGTLTSTSIRQGTLSIANGASASIASNGTVAGTSDVSTLSISGTGKLQLANNDLIIRNGSLPTIYAMLKTGFENAGNFDWNGPGIASSAAQSAGNTALGIVTGQQFLDNDTLGAGTFSGHTVIATDLLVKYTYEGDNNLDGIVDDADLFLFLPAYTGSQTGDWLAGDYTYDGLVDDADLFLFLPNYTGGASGLSAALASLDREPTPSILTAESSGLIGSAVIPEPATLSLMVLSAGWLVRRKAFRKNKTLIAQ